MFYIKFPFITQLLFTIKLMECILACAILAANLVFTMLLIKLVIFYFSTLIYLVSTRLIIVNQSEDMKYLQKCVEEIQIKFFNPTDFIMFFNLNEKFNELRLNRFPMINQNNYSKQLVWYPPTKANVYILVLSEEGVEDIFDFLIKSLHWNPRAKIIVIFEGNPSDLFKVVKKYYVFTIVVLVGKSWTETEIFTYFPYDYSKPANKRTEAVILDSCYEGVLQRKNNLFPRKLPKKWNNTTVKVVLFEYPPYVVCHACEEQKKTGIEVNIFRLVRNILGFNVSYVEKRFTTWGRKHLNGSYENIYGDLQTYQADVAFGLFYLNSTENWDFDMTFPYMEDSVRWIVPTAKIEPRWKSIAKIFNWFIWVCLVISFLATALSLYFTAIRIPEVKTYQELRECFLVCYECLIGQAVNAFPKTMTVRIIFTVWLAFTCVISTAFQSKLTNVLNAVVYEKQITTVNEMLDSKMEFGFFPPAAYFFTNTNFGRDSYICTHYIPCTLSSECVDRVAFQGDFATFKSIRHLQYLISNHYLDKNGKSLIYTLDNQLYFILISMAFSKGFPMFEHVNKLLQDFKSNGIIQFYYNRVNFFANKALQQAKHLGIRANSLTLDEFQGVFGLLLIGWIGSFVVFLIELMMKRRKFLKDYFFGLNRSSGFTRRKKLKTFYN